MTEKPYAWVEPNLGGLYKKWRVITQDTDMSERYFSRGRGPEEFAWKLTAEHRARQLNKWHRRKLRREATAQEELD